MSGIAKTAAGMGLLLATALLVSSRLPGWHAMLAGDGDPSLRIACTECDLGRIVAGRAAPARFSIENAGGRRLILIAQRASCDCLSSEPEFLVAPGSQRELVVRVDTEHLSGKLELTARYLTNDPRRPVLELRVLADVLPASQTALAPLGEAR